jgi:hypothetical protein
MSLPEIKEDQNNSLAMDDHLLVKVPGVEAATASGVAGADTESEGAKPYGIDDGRVLPPGEHPYDPVRKDIDPVAFALERVQTFLLWTEEHLAGFEKLRHADPEGAESELSNLRDSNVQGMIYLQRLSELVRAGYTLDPDKRLPGNLSRGWFSHRAKQLYEENRAKKSNK